MRKKFLQGAVLLFLIGSLTAVVTCRGRTGDKIAKEPTSPSAPGEAPEPAPNGAAARRPRIIFLSPNGPGNTYWPQVFAIVREVAADLDFDFEPYDLGVEDRFTRRKQALDILRSSPPPDAVIASVVYGDSEALLSEAEARGIPLFILGPLFPDELPELGAGPGVKYKSWAALFNWAEEAKGYALGKALLDIAEKNEAFASDGKIQVVGIGGDSTWFGSELRRAGLVRAVGENPKAVLNQVVPTQWTQAEGERIASLLMKRYPEASVFWAASDQLGAGAVAALESAGREAGVKAFTGGLDLSELGLNLVANGKFVATSASLMLCYAEVAVLAYDYAMGLDFTETLGRVIDFPAYAATGENVALHLELSSAAPRIDFRRLSRARNPALTAYDFTIAAFRAAAALP